MQPLPHVHPSRLNMLPSLCFPIPLSVILLSYLSYFLLEHSRWTHRYAHTYIHTSNISSLSDTHVLFAPEDEIHCARTQTPRLSPMHCSVSLTRSALHTIQLHISYIHTYIRTYPVITTISSFVSKYIYIFLSDTSNRTEITWGQFGRATHIVIVLYIYE
ncbi:hypothetical protein M413DRAFT_337003 [Hebeloma cylindrosporum]|uniref:Uncharacterized protein n=1 Tax=Hebeloma cylindrosporum TaxID=76867 RepID=A0A0C3CME0_HEBCY|nr:hypothetical protein M413DRAFT_337003 [Hebeloma cylindrosporum h7]